ncbi:MAG: metal-dependent transcriptional regulator [Thermoflexales bacterium]|nr:metal-dependent transcriptional regulator [Thermoflexales bacterium]MDW8350331.1 metal-dependent transcriptional regulator [Anaerolineae bacterium]
MAPYTTQVLLKEVLLESLEEKRVTLGRLGKRLGVSPPAVSRRVQRLVRRGYLERDGACGLRLTDAGTRIALYALRKQEIFEAYLVHELGYRWDELSPTATGALRMDDALIERMYVRIGRPPRCPHGLPIPSHDGHLRLPRAAPLCEWLPGRPAVISYVLSNDREILRYLAELGLTPGAYLVSAARIPFGDSIKVRVEGSDSVQEHVIGATLARMVYVEGKSTV